MDNLITVESLVNSFDVDLNYVVLKLSDDFKVLASRYADILDDIYVISSYPIDINGRFGLECVVVFD